ncbi:hypothetical protein [Micromonospora sp. CPCC 205561]|uniref:hypothetical protein n=1 Tax=Micromonospora sp. CPCC 205561 TaxID=3122407 RepID=UPI002FF11B0C
MPGKSDANLKLDKVPDALEGLSHASELLKTMALFGIEEAPAILKDSNASPEQCMAQAHTSLDFFGFHGNKWRTKPWFSEGLERLWRRGGRVRFLVVDDLTEQQREEYAALLRRWSKTFEVRLMPYPALFRLVFINNDRMVFGHYGADVLLEDGVNAAGWRSPHLIVHCGTTWSLGVPFRQYFDEKWSVARRLLPDGSIGGTAELGMLAQRREFR